MAKLFKPVYTDRKTGASKRAAKWYARYRDAYGVLRKKPLARNKDVAQRMFGALLDAVEQEKASGPAPVAAHRLRPLVDHLSAWEQSLASSTATRKHVRQTVGWARRMIAASRAVFAADLTPGLV